MSARGLKASQIVGMGEYMNWLQARQIVNRAQGLGRATSVVAHAWRHLIGWKSIGRRLRSYSPQGSRGGQ